MKLSEKILGFLRGFPKATVADIARVEVAVLPLPTEVYIEPTVDPITPKQNDAKGKNYKRSSKRGRTRSKGSKADSGLSN